MGPREVHADQGDIDTPLVREPVVAQFPQWAALSLEPVDSRGMVDAIYRLGNDLSVRLPLRPSITDEVRREQAKLAALAPLLPVSIPSVEAIGSPTDAFRRIDLPDRPPAYPGERRTRAAMVSADFPTRTAIGELDGPIDTSAALAS